MRERMAEELNLTDQQKDQMKKFRLDFERKQIGTHPKIKMARLDLKELFLKDKLDRSAIEKQMKAISDLQYQTKLDHVDHWFAVNEILTPEQQSIWKEHFGERGKRMRGHFRGRGHMEREGMPEEMSD
jgi:Spy/CpxP family protein refolding chaperone